MSNKTIINKNFKLTTKFAEYLAKNPDVKLKKLSNISYVVISHNDEELNEFNTNLIKSLKKEGKKVVKAKETNNENTPWELSIAG